MRKCLLLKIVCLIICIRLHVGTVVEVVGGVEAEVGEETEAGEGTIVGSRTGTTETETETGTRVMEVGIAQVLQTRTRGTTLIIRDHIMTATDLLFCLSGVVSGILSIHSLNTYIAVPYEEMCNCCLKIIS